MTGQHPRIDSECTRGCDKHREKNMRTIYTHGLERRLAQFLVLQVGQSLARTSFPSWLNFLRVRKNPFDAGGEGEKPDAADRDI